MMYILDDILENPWSLAVMAFKAMMVAMSGPVFVYLTIAVSTIFIIVYLRLFGPATPNSPPRDECDDAFRRVRDCVSTAFDWMGRLWFGYEVVGLDNVPAAGPAMIVFYHGALPIDYYFLSAKLILRRRRLALTIADRFIMAIPGFQSFLDTYHVNEGSHEICVAELKAGRVIGLSPGGVYEALFSGSDYDILWKERKGFARIALETGCPIIPMFTSNIREAFQPNYLGCLRRFFLKLYNATKLPLVPVVGGFPVKLVTYLGRPIDYDPEVDTPTTVRDKVQAAIQSMIEQHQTTYPGSVKSALWDRLSRKKVHQA